MTTATTVEAKEVGRKNDALWNNLSAGFTYLRACRDAELTEAPKPAPPGGTYTEHSCAVVNFVDPTASSSTASPSQTSVAGEPKQPLNLYKNLSSVFEKEYRSTLHNVPYQHIRSGANQVIENLPVRPSLSGSRDAPDIGDPCEWHKGAYCHVYIAACESLEHYRSKIKPSLQAFVSQIEAASNNHMNGAAGADPAVLGSANSYSAQYVIVYVPTGDRSAVDDTPQGVRRVGSAFASRVAKARQRITTATGREMSTDSGHSHTASVAEVNGSTVDVDNQEGAEGALTIGLLSKAEKDLVRRFNADFPSGHVCTVSTLVDESDEDDSEKDSSDKALQKTEWVSFQKTLGAAIVSGFRDRCQRYDEELKRLDTLRGAASAKKGAAEFNLGHYFLVKESLAFTYEQMHLPSEALLTYNEMQVLLPDVPSSEAKEVGSPAPEAHTALSTTALAGDTAGFRRHVRGAPELDPLAVVIEQYLFARETHLLVLMGDPVKVVARCLSFAETMFAVEGQRLTSNDPAAAERWAFDFCWNVKEVCDCYRSFQASDMIASSESETNTPGDKDFARQAGNLLEFARLRMLKLGDIMLPDSNPVRSQSRGLSEDLLTEWKPWSANHCSDECDDSARTGTGAETVTSFLDEALSSGTNFQGKYLEFAEAVVALNSASGRPRLSVRLQLDMLDIQIRRGEKACAVRTLHAISSIFAKDQWNACHFMLLFRVAGFQRQVGAPADYLKTLVDCFSDKLSLVAPPKALDVLHADLVAVASDSRISGCRLASPPLFGPSLGLQGLKEPTVAGTDRHLLKKLFSIGEKVCITLSVTSYLPKAIEVDTMAITLVPFRVYVTSVEDDIPLKDEDVFRVLQLKSPVSIHPGTNEYGIDWIPMSSGHFILASVEIEWQGTKITYTAKDMQRSTIRVDVVPCEPTQSIEVRPVFLVAGHEQPVRVAFSAGADIIEQGTLQLVCSPGLLLIPPGDDPDSAKWVGSCDVPLPPCTPGETIVLTPRVKSTDLSESTEENQSDHRLHVKVSTSYRLAHPDGLETDGEGSHEADMTSVIEYVVPTLGQPLLSVDSTQLIPYAAHRWMLTVSLSCNAPVAFTVKSWEMKLPQVLCLEADGDLNQSLASTNIVTGEHLSFGFVCILNDKGSSAASKPSTSLCVELEDEYGTVFNEILPISLKSPSVPKVKLGEIPTVPVKVIISDVQGLASAPIDLVYEVDTSGLSSLPAGNILYAIDADCNDWILSGKVEGVVNRSKGPVVRLEFVAIPCRPGSLEQYPSLSLSFAGDEKEYGARVPLAVRVTEPEPFHSTCPTKHVTVAFPIGTRASI